MRVFLAAEYEFLKRVKEALENEQTARSIECDDEEKAILDTVALLTSKPVIYACNMSEEDFKNNKTEALKVVYLESIIDENKGNNPHVGYGTYDDGKTYLEYFRQLFKYEIDNNSSENLFR